MPEPIPAYRVFAIRYAHREAAAHEHFYRADACDSSMPMSYYVWLIVSDDGAIVVDTGFTRQTAEERGRDYIASPLDTMRRLGVDPDEVHQLVLTHFHFDHTGHAQDFPSAQIVVQEQEMRFWFGPNAGLGEYPSLAKADDLSGLVAANLNGRLRWVNGEADLVPGVSVHLVAGHTPGSQVVRVMTNQGPVVLAGDASHFYANLEQNKPYAIVHTLPEMYAAFITLRKLAGPREIIIPGHDPEVMVRFPAPSPELEGVVVQIA